MTSKSPMPDAAEQMASVLRQGAAQLAATRRLLLQLAHRIEQGALRGRGGTAFAGALREQLAPALQRLAGRYAKQEAEIRQAISGEHTPESTQVSTTGASNDA